MKKFIALFLIMVIVCTSCKSSSSLKRITNTVMTNEFQKSIEAMYDNDNDLESLFIPSFGTDKSMLKTLALYNLCNTKYSENIGFEAERNAYRCSIEASLNSGKDEVMVNLLTNEATEEDFYEAYRVATIIKSDDLLETVNKKYEDYKHIGSCTISDQVYRFLNGCYYYKSFNEDYEDLSDDVIKYIETYIGCEYLDTTFDALANLTACVVFLQEYNIHSQDKLLEELYQCYTDEKNERVMIFEAEVSFEYYCRIVGMLRSYLNIQNHEDFFFQVAKKERDLYSGLSYDIMTAKNFSMYVISLSYTDISISEEQMLLLKSLYEQIVKNTQPNDYFSIFYLNIASEYLGTDKIQVSLNEQQNSVPYLWVTNQKTEFSALYVPNSDIVQFLMACDVSYEGSQQREMLIGIDIFDYVNEEGFSQILNLYVCVMSSNHLITDNLQRCLFEYIQNAECVFGYKESNGNYDFRASVYYTNIKYILGGGEDIGLR